MCFVLEGVFRAQQTGGACILYDFMYHLADKSCGRTFVI
jgi:hypothetical protein